MKKLIIICGPTAVGKSDIAFKLAKKFNTEIISADSRQVYRHLNIGTAKPSKIYLKNIKHHFIDIIEPVEKYSAGQFVRKAEKIITNFNANAIPIICGGTGLYIRSLTDWNLNLPYDDAIKKKLDNELTELGIENLYNRLQSIDPAEAESIDKHNKVRVTRALEVIQITNKKVSELKKNFIQKKYNYLKLYIHLPRDIIYKNINLRVDKMIESGLIDETQKLLATGLKNSSPGLNTIGYKETIHYLKNLISKDEAIDKIKQNTRRYAKRQTTWFKKEKNIIFCPNDFDYINILCERFIDGAVIARG